MSDLDLKNAKSEALAYMVLMYTKLKINKEQAILALQELDLRAANGDTFDYATYIEDAYAQMSKPTDINKLKAKITAAPKIIGAELSEFTKNFKL
jgi:hypothetical protein